MYSTEKYGTSSRNDTQDESGTNHFGGIAHDTRRGEMMNNKERISLILTDHDCDWWTLRL